MIAPQNYPFVFAIVHGDNKHEKISSAVQWAAYWLKFKALCNSQGSVIFDIDDTLVDEKEKGIKSMIQLYKLCLKLEFVVNIITARPESKENRRETQKMLHGHGIDTYEALYMMPSNVKPTLNTISKYKYNARMDVTTRHTILANFGDMWTDHVVFPCPIEQLKTRDVQECAIMFPGVPFPCVKLPGEE